MLDGSREPTVRFQKVSVTVLEERSRALASAASKAIGASNVMLFYSGHVARVVAPLVHPKDSPQGSSILIANVLVSSAEVLVIVYPVEAILDATNKAPGVPAGAS